MSEPRHPPPALLELRGIHKRFGDVQANRGVDLTLGRGEILGLLGENGAGKTTLMNILFGLYTADRGTILVEGEPVSIRSPRDAIRHRIGMVHQHFHLVARHSVLENVLVGEPGRAGRLDRERARARIEALGRELGLALDPGRAVSTLSVGEQQRVEIVKALFRGARVLVLDEPTSVLTPQESERLFDALRAMARQGVGIVFISHKLNEVRALTDRIAIMRSGRIVETLANHPELDNRTLAERMCGRPLSPPVRRPLEPGPELMRLDAVSSRGEEDTGLREVSLSVRGGEILGVAGVAGNGQRALVELMAGLRRPSAGRLVVRGNVIREPSVAALQRLGVAHVPEDRLGEGLVPTLPLADSMVLSRLRSRRFSRLGWLRRSRVEAFVREQMERFDIRAPGPWVRTGTLSGGNLQKALLARELAFDPHVLVAAQPTRGLDAGAQEFVHRQLLAQRERGRAVVVVSEDLEELFTLSDRIAVLYEGRIAGLLPTAEASVAGIGLLMSGAGGAA